MADWCLDRGRGVVLGVTGSLTGGQGQRNQIREIYMSLRGMKKGCLYCHLFILHKTCSVTRRKFLSLSIFIEELNYIRLHSLNGKQPEVFALVSRPVSL